MSPPRPLLAVASALLAVPAAAQAPPKAIAAAHWSGPENVLVLLADDLGVDQLAVYAESSDYPTTPHIDALAEQGVRFRNVWSNPYCSPTRATIMTGRFAFRTGIGDLVASGQHGGQGGYALQPSEFTLPELVEAGTAGVYSHAAIGKWHLGNPTVGGPLAVNLAGWQHFDGTDDNLIEPYDYFFWKHIVNGAVFDDASYITVAQVDAALGWIQAVPEPWIAYVAFTTPHHPFHAPPAGLYTVDLAHAGDPGTNPRPYYKAMVESMDHEIGRLLDGLGAKRERTNVIFLGDNGTPSNAVVPPLMPGKAKGSMFEGGVNVPMIVAGPRVASRGSESEALVITTDLYATIAELCGVEDAQSFAPPGLKVDSVSVVPYLAEPSLPSIRKWAFTEHNSPTGPTPTVTRRAVRDGRYKLIRFSTTGDRLFDLEADPLETTDLLGGPLSHEQLQAYEKLSGLIDQILAS